jgi:hypothetical protein
MLWSKFDILIVPDQENIVWDIRCSMVRNQTLLNVLAVEVMTIELIFW